MQRRAFIASGAKLIVASLACSTAVLPLAGCGGGSDAPAGGGPPAGNGPPPNLAGDAIKVYPGANDPRIVGGIDADGERYVMQGVKDPAGKPLQVSDIQFLGPNEQTSALQFVRGQAPGLRGLEDGTEATLSDHGAGGFVFGLAAGNRQLQINLPAASLGLAAAAASAPKQAAVARSRLGMRARFSSARPACGGCHGGGQAALQPKAVNAPIVEVDVTGCVGENPMVQVFMRDETGKLVDLVYGQRTGPGRYTAALTDLNTSDQAFAEAAQAALLFLKEFDLTDGAFAAMFAKLKGVTTDAIAESVIKELENSGKYAETLDDFQQVLDLSPEDLDAARRRAVFKEFIGKKAKLMLKSADLYSKLQQSMLAGDALAKLIDAYGQEQFNGLQLQARVVTGKGEKFSSVGTGIISPNGPYPDLSVQGPAQTDVSSFALSPANPAGGQDYAATGQIFCLAQGDVVTLGISGSDGYSDTSTQTVGQAESQSFTLSVPGAASGVRDVVTIQVERGGAVVASRTASLVFG